nr:cytochrome c oxidase subunit 5A, mitochondrial-like [Onthophagus taurus]
MIECKRDKEKYSTINCEIYIKFFDRSDIDGWDLRQGMTDLLGYDNVPDPKIIIAIMYACRRVNDYALAVRFIEAVKNKAGGRCAQIYPYIIQEIGPVICELGIDTPEVLGYDKPELYLQDIYDIH